MGKYPKVPYRSNYKHQVGDYIIMTPIKPPTNITTKWVDLNTDGLMMIKEGFGSDGTSFVESLLDRWWLTLLTFKQNKKLIGLMLKGSFVHDALYYLFKMDALFMSFRPDADLFARLLWIDSGCSEWWADYCYKKLKRWGGSSALPENARPVLYAK